MVSSLLCNFRPLVFSLAGKECNILNDVIRLSYLNDCDLPAYKCCAIESVLRYSYYSVTRTPTYMMPAYKIVGSCMNLASSILVWIRRSTAIMQPTNSES